MDDSPLNESTPEDEKVFKKAPSMQEYLKNTSSIKKVPTGKGKKFVR